MAWSTPKTDWIENPKSPMAEDFNRIEENIDFLNTDIETKKGAIVDAINTMGRSVTMANTHTELAIAIKDISDDATAAEGDVLSNKTFYQGGIKRTGTMASKSHQVFSVPFTNRETETKSISISYGQTVYPVFKLPLTIPAGSSLTMTKVELRMGSSGYTLPYNGTGYTITYTVNYTNKTIELTITDTEQGGYTGDGYLRISGSENFDYYA